MNQWFYVKNDLSEREDVKGVIQHTIRSRFGIWRPSIADGNEAQACLMAFNTCAPTLALEIWFRSTLLIRYGLFLMIGRCRRRPLLVLVKVAWFT
jgi:hypothetical protein